MERSHRSGNFVFNEELGKKLEFDVVVIGAGASGLMAGISASENGAHVLIIEKNEKSGKKIYITGKGRCNITNIAPRDEFLENIVTNKRFFMSAFSQFSNFDTMDFFENNGVKLKVERGGRVFPESDKASDVSKALENRAKLLGVEFLYDSTVKSVNKTKKGYEIITNRKTIETKTVIVATGGNTYSSTGSTGDGYSIAKKFGHKIVPIRPGLVPIRISDEFISSLEGVSLKNVDLIAKKDEKVFKSFFGEMLFCCGGITGPISLSLSSFIAHEDLKNISISIDLKPALSKEQLFSRLSREFSENGTKILSNVLKNLSTSSLVPIIIKKAGITASKKVCEISNKEKEKLVEVFKNFSLSIVSLFPLDVGIVTSGGVDTDDVIPKTLESKLADGLFFAGEILDIDALTGGFNLQIALSTGFVAGKSAGLLTTEQEKK